MYTIILTEGNKDKALLQSLLAFQGKDGVEIIACSGKGSATSSARTMMSTRSERIILVLDMDAPGKGTSMENLRLLVGPDTDRFRLIMLEPEIEVLFFVDRGALTKALGNPIPDVVWEIGMSAPKSTLSALLGKGPQHDPSTLLASASLLEAMRNHPKIKEIQEFAQVAHA
jgi:hypothetical protein